MYFLFSQYSLTQALLIALVRKSLIMSTDTFYVIEEWEWEFGLSNIRAENYRLLVLYFSLSTIKERGRQDLTSQDVNWDLRFHIVKLWKPDSDHGRRQFSGWYIRVWKFSARNRSMWLSVWAGIQRGRPEAHKGRRRKQVQLLLQLRHEPSWCCRCIHCIEMEFESLCRCEF